MPLTDEKLARLREVSERLLFRLAGDDGVEESAAADRFQDEADPSTMLALLERITNLERDRGNWEVRCEVALDSLTDVSNERDRLITQRDAIIHAHAIEGDHCEDDVVRAVVERKHATIDRMHKGQDAAYARGRADERADVVRFLDTCRRRGFKRLLDEVERGEHVAKGRG